MEQRLPVTILSGFLGSGKTTLMNHLLDSMHRQCVHGSFRLTLGAAWGDAMRRARLVFIGRHLEREAIAASLEAAMA